MKIALHMSPEAGATSTLMKQCGIKHAVAGIGLQPIPGASEEEQPWSYSSLMQAKASYEKNGFEMSVIESRPPMEKIKLGLAGREEEIEIVCAFLRNMGKAGIPVWCSAWMPILSILRTSYAIPSRGGARVSGYDHDQLRDEPLTEYGLVEEEQQWENLRYFLQRVVPVAEGADVKMAMHPDDPPLSPIRGVARIMSSIDNYQRMVDLVPSPANGIELCQGNFSLMTDDLPAAIRQFGEQKKISFVHLRDVRGTPEKFAETFHDDGQTDLVECLRAYRDVGYEGECRPDHYPEMGDDSFDNSHHISQLFAVGYLKGLREAVYSERQ